MWRCSRVGLRRWARGARGAKDFFRKRYATLRSEVRRGLTEVCDLTDPPTDIDLDYAAAAIIAVMDGLQIQWLLAPDEIRLAESSAFAIDAILAAAIQGHRRRIL